MKISTGKILLITLLLTAITVAIALYISVNQSKKINTTFLSVSHTQNILFFAEKLLAEVTQSEMLAREFILTGDEDHLSSFNKLKSLIQNDFDKLRRSTIDNEVQQKRLDTLSEYIGISLRTSDNLISSDKSVQPQEIIALVSKAKNSDNMVAIKNLIDSISNEEQRLLSVRKNESTVAISNFRALLFLTFALLVILMMILVQKLRVEVISDREAYRIMQYNTLLMDNIRDAVISTDKDLCIVSWNDKAEKIFGWKEEEVRGKPVLSVVKPGYKDEGRAAIIKRVKSSGIWDGEINLEKKDGQKITASLSWSAIRDTNGRIRGSITIARDVTPRKQLEEQLKRFNAKLGKQVEERKAEIKHVVERLVSSEKKYKQLFENNPLPMMMLSYPELNIIDVNETAILQYGFTKEMFLKKNIKDIQVKEEFLDFKDYIKEDVAGYQEAGVWRHYKIDGTIISVEIFVHSMIIDGLKTKLVLAHDITQKIETEKKQTEYLEQIRMLTGYLQEVREAERKNIAREIHDELGQQLTVLKLEIAWMIKKLDVNEENIRMKLTELLDTIDGTMTAVRRICAELRPTVLDDIGLEAAMEWHIKQFQQATGIKVKLLSVTEEFHIAADIKTALFRIFQESLTNIARHANASTVQVEMNKENEFITLMIADDGSGFDMAVADQKRTLGILGMKERSLALGGVYKINSKPGKGTTIQVRIPLLHSEEKLDILNKKTG